MVCIFFGEVGLLICRLGFVEFAVLIFAGSMFLFLVHFLLIQGSVGVICIFGSLCVSIFVEGRVVIAVMC